MGVYYKTYKTFDSGKPSPEIDRVLVTERDEFCVVFIKMKDCKPELNKYPEVRPQGITDDASLLVLFGPGPWIEESDEDVWNYDVLTLELHLNHLEELDDTEIFMSTDKYEVTLIVPYDNTWVDWWNKAQHAKRRKNGKA